MASDSNWKIILVVGGLVLLAVFRERRCGEHQLLKVKVPVAFHPSIAPRHASGNKAALKVGGGGPPSSSTDNASGGGTDTGATASGSGADRDTGAGGDPDFKPCSVKPDYAEMTNGIYGQQVLCNHEQIRSVQKAAAEKWSECPRVVLVLNGFPLGFGRHSLRSGGLRSVKRVLTEFDTLLDPDLNFPALILNQDYRDQDKEALRKVTKRLILFHTVVYDEVSVPEYMPRRAELFAGWRDRAPYHQLGVPPGKIHSFGYFQMTRIYSQLLAFHPIMENFDYYFRADTDSSYTALSTAVWKKVVEVKPDYIGYGLGMMNMDTRTDVKILEAGIEHAKQFAPQVGNYDRRSYYNNMELVKLEMMLSKAHVALFSYLDRAGLFYQPWLYEDASFRTVYLQTFVGLNPPRVLDSGGLVHYHHPYNPVADVCPPELTDYCNKNMNRQQLYEATRTLGVFCPDDCLPIETTPWLSEDIGGTAQHS